MQCDDLELDRFHVPSSERHLHTQPKKPNRGPKVGIAVFGHETYDLGCGPCACENVKSKRNWLSSLDVWMSLLSCRVLLNVQRSLKSYSRCPHIRQNRQNPAPKCEKRDAMNNFLEVLHLLIVMIPIRSLLWSIV